MNFTCKEVKQHEQKSDRDYENEPPKEKADIEASSEPVVYWPICPDDAPAVLTFSDITVTKKGGNKKKLLNNISGSISGGLWAIMGKCL